MAFAHPYFLLLLLLLPFLAWLKGVGAVRRYGIYIFLGKAGFEGI